MTTASQSADSWQFRIPGGSALPGSLRGGIVAIGNFDGVHRGHQAVLGRALEDARRDSVPALALTFEPHPRTLFNPQNPVYRITPAPIKARLLRALGFDAVIEYPFTREFAGQSPDAFVGDVLVGQLGISGAVAGFDFHFGKNRQGGPAYMMEAGKRLGFSVDLIDAFRDEGTEVISSSRIRDCLSAGDLAEANGLLGYRHTVGGTIIRGRQLGRTLGFPTANIRLPEDTGLRRGIYAVRLRRPDGSLNDGVASFGRRPTVEDAGEPLLEVHVFDLEENLYDEDCTVSLFAFLRAEAKFDGLDALTAQMKRDEEAARSHLMSVRPLGELDNTVAFGP